MLFLLEQGGCSARAAARFLSREDLDACEWPLDESGVRDLCGEVGRHDAGGHALIPRELRDGA